MSRRDRAIFDEAVVSLSVFYGLWNNIMVGSTTHPATGDTTELMGTVLRFLDEERLAYLYTELLKHGDWMATQDLIEASGLPKSTVYEALSDLRETPLVTVEKDGRQRLYRSNPFQLGVLSQGEITTMTPTTLAAVGYQVIDEDVETFVEDYGIDTLLRVIEYVKPYIDGRMSERVAARELDLPTVVGMTIMIALEDVVTEMQDVDPYFESIRDASKAGPQTPDEGPIEVQYDEMTRIVIEPADDDTEQSDVKTSERKSDQ